MTDFERTDAHHRSSWGLVYQWSTSNNHANAFIMNKIYLSVYEVQTAEVVAVYLDKEPLMNLEPVDFDEAVIGIVGQITESWHKYRSIFLRDGITVYGGAS